MHVRTNIEHNITHVIVVAICPLLLVSQTMKESMFFIIATALCFLISAFVCFVFNKYLSRNIKVFVTMILSTFIITIFNELIRKSGFLGLQSSNDWYFVVLSTVCLCVDIYFIDTKAMVQNYFLKLISDCLLYAALMFVYTFVIEFLAYGTMFNKQVFKFAGEAFFSTITFKLLWLGILCIIADALYRVYMKNADKKKMTYQKYVKKIRDEKEFQYNELYRNKLLTSEVEVKTISGDMAEEMKQKSAENASIAEEKPEEEVEEDTKKTKKKKQKKQKKSKGAKVEKAFNVKNIEGDEN